MKQAHVRKGDLWLPDREIVRPDYGHVLPFRRRELALVTTSFDSRFSKSVSGASPQSFVSNAGDNPGTVGSNSNRVLIGGFSYDAVADVSNVAMTWNSVPMTFIVQSGDILGGKHALLFGLVDPDTGNQTLQVSWTGGGSVAFANLCAWSLFGSAPISWKYSSANSGTSTNASSNVGNNVARDGDMGVCLHQSRDTSATILNGTEDWNVPGTSGGANTISLGAHSSTVFLSRIDIGWTTSPGNTFFHAHTLVGQIVPPLSQLLSFFPARNR